MLLFQERCLLDKMSDFGNDLGDAGDEPLRFVSFGVRLGETCSINGAGRLATGSVFRILAISIPIRLPDSRQGATGHSWIAEVLSGAAYPVPSDRPRKHHQPSPSCILR